MKFDLISIMKFNAYLGKSKEAGKFDLLKDTVIYGDCE